MYFHEIECFDYILGMLSIIQLMRDYQKADQLLDQYDKCEIDPDFECELFLDAMGYAVEFLSVHYIESEDCEEYFMADETMTEYYRLCRDYGRKCGIKWKMNPYVQKADQMVKQSMDTITDYGFSWKISTGVRHKYASSLHFYRYPDFMQTVQLIESVLEIFEFYHTEIKILKAELSKPDEKELIAA